MRPAEIRIGIIGLGSMGKGLVYQSLITKGIRTVAVCDSDLQKACGILREFKLDYTITENPAQLMEIASKGRIAVFEDGNVLAGAPGFDAVLEATGTIMPGGQFAVTSLNSGKHLILMNSEVDLIFGPYLNRLAKQHNLICSSCGGDQYGVLKPLVDDLRFWGFELVMAGNIKGFLDRYANPSSIIAEANKRNLDYKACASYTDGTKLNIEMALIANALGLRTKTPGMHGPACRDVGEALSVFDLETLWSDKEPFVDYVLGANPGGGVFAIGYCGNGYQREMLQYYKMGDGPFYTFYRPYHLCHIEAMGTVIDAVAGAKALLQPKHGFVTNVYAYAKRDLRKGETLDGVGGYTCYGLIENCGSQLQSPSLPICLADGVTLKSGKKKDEKIFLEDVIYEEQRADFRLFSASQAV